MTLLHLPWYYIILYVVMGIAVLWVVDKYKIIKSKSLRYFVFIFFYTIIFWIIYDLFLASE